MVNSSQGKPAASDLAAPSSAGAAMAAAVTGTAAPQQASPAEPGAAAAPATQEKSLSRTQHVVELADGLSHIADQLHERIMREIRSYDGRRVPTQVQDTMRQLFDDEMVLRQRANSLYADAAAFVIQGLDQPQSRLVALTADAAKKIRRIAVIAEMTGLVGGLLQLAGAVASGKPTPVALALEKLRLHATALDALKPPPTTSAS